MNCTAEAGKEISDCGLLETSGEAEGKAESGCKCRRNALQVLSESRLSKPDAAVTMSRNALKIGYFMSTEFGFCAYSCMVQCSACSKNSLEVPVAE